MPRVRTKRSSVTQIFPTTKYVMGGTNMKTCAVVFCFRPCLQCSTCTRPRALSGLTSVDEDASWMTRGRLRETNSNTHNSPHIVHMLAEAVLLGCRTPEEENGQRPRIQLQRGMQPINAQSSTLKAKPDTHARTHARQCAHAHTLTRKCTRPIERVRVQELRAP